MISQHNCVKVPDMKMGLDANNAPFPPRDPESFFPLTNIFLGGEITSDLNSKNHLCGRETRLSQIPVRYIWFLRLVFLLVFPKIQGKPTEINNLIVKVGGSTSWFHDFWLFH